MDEQRDGEQTIPHGSAPKTVDQDTGNNVPPEQATPWYQACASSAVPTLSTLATAALINLPDLITFVYGGGGGGGSPKGH